MSLSKNIFLLKLRLVKISEQNIQKWKETKQVDKIEYALKHSNFKLRKLAAEALGDIGEESSIPLLFEAIHDEVKIVSIAALNALERIGCNDELGSTLINKRFNWLKKQRDTEIAFEKNKNKKSTIYKWERSSKKSFDRVKEQLRKGIR